MSQSNATSTVKVVVQLPPEKPYLSRRIECQLPSSLTLWKVLEQFEKEHRLPLTTSSSPTDSSYLLPSLLTTTNSNTPVEFSSLSLLFHTPVSSLLVSSARSILFRLQFKSTSFPISGLQLRLESLQKEKQEKEKEREKQKSERKERQNEEREKEESRRKEEEIALRRTIDQQHAARISSFSSSSSPSTSSTSSTSSSSSSSSYSSSSSSSSNRHSSLNLEIRLSSLSSSIDSLSDETPTSEAFLIAMQTLLLIVSNLLKSKDKKYRSFNLNGNALKAKIGYEGARNVLKAVGFTASEEAAVGDEKRVVLKEENEDTQLIEMTVSLLKKAMQVSQQREVEQKTAEATPIITPSPSDHVTPDPSPLSGDTEMREERIAEGKSVQFDDLKNESMEMEDDYSPPPLLPSPRPVSDDPLVSVDDDKPRYVDLTPSYNVTEIRTALTRLKDQVFQAIEAANPIDSNLILNASTTRRTVDDLSYEQREAYLAVLILLQKITSNLLKDNAPQKRTLNLGNETLRKKIAPYEGARQYLKFLGFIDQASTTNTDSSSSSSTSGGSNGNGVECNSSMILTLPPSREDPQKILRADQILSRIVTEHSFSSAELDHRALGAIDRDLHVYNYDPSLPNASLLPREAENNEVNSKSDAVLLLQSAMAQRKEIAELTRTDVIITKQKREELKQANRRKYTKTLLRIVFPNDQLVIHLYFRPLETLSCLFTYLSSLLIFSDEPFHLRSPPTSRFSPLIDSQRTFSSCGLVPAATLTFHFDSGVPSTGCLKREVMEMKEEPISSPVVPQAENKEELERKRMKMIEEQKKAARMEAGGSGTGRAMTEEERLEAEVERRLAGGMGAGGKSSSSSSSSSKKPSWLKR